MKNLPNNTSRQAYRWLTVGLITAFLAACGGGGGATGPAGIDGPTGTTGGGKLQRIMDEPAGVNCPAAGQRIDEGVDTNINSVLDNPEITSTVYVCNGVSAKTWGKAALIETDNAGDAKSPKVAIDAGGNAVAVWSDSASFNIWANRFTPAAGWGTPALIETNNIRDANPPQVAIDASGNAVAVWVEGTFGNATNIWTNRFTPAAGWGTATPLTEIYYSGPSPNNPRVAIDASGNAVAVWAQSDGSRYPAISVWARRFTPAVGWDTAVRISTNIFPNTFVNGLQVAIDASGNAVVVWAQSEFNTPATIFANRFTPGAGWGITPIMRYTLSERYIDFGDTQVAIDASGNVVAVWYHFDGTRFNIWANRFTPAAGWGTAALIETDNAGDANSPQIAIDASGNAVAVWTQSDGTRFNIWANRFTPAAGWGTAAMIETDNAGDANRPQIAIDASGNAVAVWPQSDGTRFNIWANRFTPAAGWGTAAMIETDNAGDAYSPQIAIDASGNAVAVWSQYDGTRFNIWANRLQ